MVVSKPLQNLFLDIQGSSDGVKPGGLPLERTITIHNRGSQTAYLDLWLEPTDQQSMPLQRWSTFDKSETDLTLLPDQSLDVVLTIEVPLQAVPGFYSYDIRMRSSQYPGEEIRRVQQLQILPSDQEAQLRSEPKLTIVPNTDAENPYELAAGEVFEITVTVENPSRRTDRFFLECLNWSKEWFTVQYPENTDNLPGLVTYTDGLQLNPRETGDIRLLIHPPNFAPAGSYFPTLRLTSPIREEVVLLRVIYFDLAVNDRLSIRLEPQTLPIPSLEQTFQIFTANTGNIERHVAYDAWDPEKLVAYRLEPSELVLPPGAETTIEMTVHPRRWWQRLWRLKERRVNFDLVVANIGIEAETEWQPAVPKPLPTGTVLLKIRRRWLFRLIVISSLVALGWIVWEFLFWRPSLRPRVTDFSTSQDTYQEGEGAPLGLDWDITNPREVGTIILSSPTYNLAQQYHLNNSDKTIPVALEEAGCVIEVGSGNTSILETLLRLYRRWKTGSPNQEFLKCRNIAVAPLVKSDRLSAEELAFGEGVYEFKLTVMPKSERAKHPLDVSLLEDVTVAPPKPPQIALIEATAAEYRTLPEAPPDGEAAAESPEAQTAATAEVEESSTATVPIRLNWIVSNAEDIQELRLVSLTPDGAENTMLKPFLFGPDGSPPPELVPWCTTANNQLTCKEVPTTATAVGEYVFYLTVITEDSDPDNPIVKNTPVIAIKPPKPIIVDFQVNGESVSSRPRHVYTLNPARSSWDLALSWDIRGEETVELLPAPGVIQGDSIVYTLSASPGEETITLRAVNELDEEVVQSVVIEKVEYVPGSQPLRRRRDNPAPAVENLDGLPALPPRTRILPVPDLAPIQTPPQGD